MRETPPDLVLLDLMLPDLGGWAVYQVMKDDADLCNIPVIVITAQNTIDRVLGEHIAKCGVYITKPFTPNELRTAVNTVLTPETDTLGRCFCPRRLKCPDACGHPKARAPLLIHRGMRVPTCSLLAIGNKIAEWRDP